MNEKPGENKYEWLKISSQCSYIPIYIALFPVVYYFIGAWLDGVFGTTWLAMVFVFLGFFSGFRQAYFALKKVIVELNKQK